MIIPLELSRRQYDGINALKSKEKLVGRVKRKLKKQISSKELELDL